MKNENENENENASALSVKEPIAEVEKRLNLVGLLDAFKATKTPYEAFQIAKAVK